MSDYLTDAEFELYSAKKNFHLHMTGRIHQKYGKKIDFESCPKCYRTVHRVLDAMLAVARAREEDMTYKKPPEGWFTFGTHITGAGSKSVPLRFSFETDEGGMPLWEQPMSVFTPNAEDVREQYTREQPPQIGTVAEKNAEFARFLEEFEQQIREKVADAILAEYNGRVSLEHDSYNEGFMDALDIAEQIARGGCPQCHLVRGHKLDCTERR